MQFALIKVDHVPVDIICTHHLLTPGSGIKMCDGHCTLSQILSLTYMYTCTYEANITGHKRVYISIYIPILQDPIDTPARLFYLKISLVRCPTFTWPRTIDNRARCCTTKIDISNI